jgi:hypothetical protein
VCWIGRNAAEEVVSGYAINARHGVANSVFPCAFGVLLKATRLGFACVCHSWLVGKRTETIKT